MNIYTSVKDIENQIVSGPEYSEFRLILLKDEWTDDFSAGLEGYDSDQIGWVYLGVLNHPSKETFSPVLFDGVESTKKYFAENNFKHDIPIVIEKR